MKSPTASLLMLCAAMLLLSTTAVRAEDTPPPAVSTAADACTASAGAITATADGKPLQAGAGVIVRDGPSPRLTITVPGTFGGVLPQLGDKATIISTDGGNTRISWTLADGKSAYRFLNLTARGEVRRVVTALNLRGLAPCVQSPSGADELDLKLPHDLGTVRFTPTASDWSSITVGAGSDTDTLVLGGTVRPADLAHSSLTLAARSNGALTQLGSVAFTAGGLESGALSLPAPLEIGTAAGSLKVARLSLQLVAGGGSRVIAGIVPPLPAALPFTLTPVDVELLARPGGAVTMQCAGDATATATAPLIGTPPNLTLALGGPDSPIALKCEAGRFTTLSGILAITWPSIGGSAPGTVTSFAFVAGGGAPTFTPLNGQLPSLRFDALGLDASVTSPALSSVGSQLFLDGQFALALRFVPEFPTAQAAVRLAIRPPAGGGQPSFALMCGTPAAAKRSAAGEITLEPHCGGSEIDGVMSDGGLFKLPAMVGAGSIAVPKFSIVRGELDLPQGATCVPPTATGSPQPFMQFGALKLNSCKLAYSAASGLIVTVGGSVELPQYVVAGGATLNVVKATIGQQAKSKRFGLTFVDANLMPASSVRLFGMDVTAYKDADSTSCKDGNVPTARGVER